MTLARKIALNMIFQIIGKMIYFGLSIVIIILITRDFGVNGYGTYNIILVYLSLFGVVADFGLQVLLSREIANNKNYHHRFRAILGLRITSTIIFFLLSFLLLFVLPYDLIIKKGILIYSIGMFFYMLNNLIFAFFQNRIEVYKNSIAEVIGRIIVLIGVVILIKLNLGILWVIWASVLGMVIGFFINYGFILKKFFLYPVIDFKIWKAVLKDAIPLAIVFVLYTLFFQIDSFLLSIISIKNVVFEFLKGMTNTQAVGIYGVAFRIITVAMTFPAIFMTLLFPFISRFVKNHDIKGLRRYFQYSIDFSLLLALPLMVIGVIIAPQIVFLIAGKEFIASVLPFRIWFLSLPFIFLFSATGYIFMAYNYQKKLILSYVFYLVFNIVLNLVLIPYFSYLGAAVATFLTEILVVLVNFHLIKKYFNLRVSGKKISKQLIAIIPSATVVYLIALKFSKGLNIFQTVILTVICILLAYIVFLFVLYLLKGIDQRQIKKVFAKSD